MSAGFIYPGTFDPPTYGHLHIVNKAFLIVPSLTIICSRNAEKDEPLFSADERVELWKNYGLPSEVTVVTLSAFMKRTRNKPIVMIRGIRDVSDYQHEETVMKLNHETFAIDYYIYIHAEKDYEGVSASRARQAAQAGSVGELYQLVHRNVAKLMLARRKR